MEYRAVGTRCAVNVDSLRVPISHEESVAVLQQKGFVAIEVDIIECARKCIGTSHYRRGARFSEAPRVVDCSSFVKWLYARRGIWLPRRSIQQREFGDAVSLDALVAGDVVFTSGWIDYYHDTPRDGVGHVGIATGEGTVIHTADRNGGVIESSQELFTSQAKFRGARRYIPIGARVITFETPQDREVETEDDIRWIIMQSLPLDH